MHGVVGDEVFQPMVYDPITSTASNHYTQYLTKQYTKLGMDISGNNISTFRTNSRTSSAFTAVSSLPTIHCSEFTADHSLQWVHCPPFIAVSSLPTIHCSEFTAHHSLQWVHCRPFTAVSYCRPFTAVSYCRPFTAVSSLPTIYCSELTADHSLQSKMKSRICHINQRTSQTRESRHLRTGFRTFYRKCSGIILYSGVGIQQIIFNNMQT